MKTEIYLWVWDPLAQKSWRILDDECYSTMYPNYGSIISTEWEAPYSTILTVAFSYDTRGHQNGLHTIGIAAEFGNPFGPPIVLGSPPPDAATNGVSGGAAGAMDLLNLVITSYSTSNGTQDYFKYDPDGDASLARPEVTFTVEDADPSPLTCQVWMEPTGGTQPQTPSEFTGPFTSLDVAGPGTYTSIWDGSYYPGGDPDQAAWGTYTFDAYAFKGGGWDWASAKTPYNLAVPASILYQGQTVPGHNVWDTQDEDCVPIDLRCNYALHSADGVEPESVVLTPLDGELAERAALSGPTGLDVLHNGADGQGLMARVLTDDDRDLYPWRVVVGAQSGSGDQVRRDRTNPRMLACNKVKYRALGLAVHGFNSPGPSAGTMASKLKRAGFVVPQTHRLTAPDPLFVYARWAGDRLGPDGPLWERWPMAVAAHFKGHACPTRIDCAAGIERYALGAHERQPSTLTLADYIHGGPWGGVFLQVQGCHSADLARDLRALVGISHAVGFAEMTAQDGDGCPAASWWVDIYYRHATILVDGARKALGTVLADAKWEYWRLHRMAEYDNDYPDQMYGYGSGTCFGDPAVQLTPPY